MSNGKVEDAGAAAASMEAYFLRRILAEVKSGQALGGGGFAADTFKEMMDEALADAMTDAGGVGLADMVARELEDHPATGKPRDPVDELTGLKIRAGRPNL
jgi:Rod binding domain-containing protein